MTYACFHSTLKLVPKRCIRCKHRTVFFHKKHRAIVLLGDWLFNVATLKVQLRSR